MPVYEYKCTVCGLSFEKRLHFSDDPNLVVCPNGHRQVRRRFSKPGIVFKGSGFYVTDSRKASDTAQSAAAG